jgi:hypothetical protein
MDTGHDVVLGSDNYGSCWYERKEPLHCFATFPGVFEAGFVPKSYHYIGTLPPVYNAGFRLDLFAGRYAFGAAFASPMAYVALKITSLQYDDWQTLFLLEGALTLGLDVATYFLLPEHVSTAWMLKPDERAHAAYRLEIDGCVFEGTILSTRVRREESPCEMSEML